jgi:hypothetical protein
MVRSMIGARWKRYREMEYSFPPNSLEGTFQVTVLSLPLSCLGA